MKKKTTVMIVDDHLLFREAWALLFNSNESFEVVLETGNVQKAIDTARDKKPAIVLIDINMGKFNGFDVLKSILDHSPSSAAIGVSMHSQPAYARKMIRCGAKGYITKNSDTKELMHAVDEVLAGRKYICNEVKDILSESLVEQPIDRTLSLTNKELEIINHIKEGLSSKEIAATMNISPKTVEVHRYRILKKMNVKNSSGLIQALSQYAA